MRNAAFSSGMRLLVAALLSLATLFAESAQMLSIKDQRVRIVLDRKGTPAAVFESGLGEDASTWAAVQPEVAKFTTALAFDRPGLGASAPTTAPRDGVTLARELRDLLATAHLPPPYILVGHSLGGAVIQLFANQYPAEIAGLVLVDPEDGRIVLGLKSKLSAKEWHDRQAALARFGPMPAAVQREYDATVSQTGTEVARIRKLPKVPTILLTATAVDPSFPGNPQEQKLKWDLHRELMTANPAIKQVMVPKSRHYIQNDDPKKVIEAIREVWDRAKTHARRF